MTAPEGLPSSCESSCPAMSPLTMSFSPSTSQPHLLHVGHDGYPQGDLERQVLKMAELPISPEAQMVKSACNAGDLGSVTLPDLSLSFLVVTICAESVFINPHLSSQQVSLEPYVAHVGELQRIYPSKSCVVMPFTLIVNVYTHMHMHTHTHTHTHTQRKEYSAQFSCSVVSNSL